MPFLHELESQSAPTYEIIPDKPKVPEPPQKEEEKDQIKLKLKEAKKKKKVPVLKR